MKKIIFTKYSNERDDRFKVKTSIVKNENNVLFIDKSPLAKEAKVHVNNMYKTYKLLSEDFIEENLCVNECEIKGESVEFKYLEGETLEKKLDGLLDANDYGGLLELLGQYKKVIYSIKTRAPFVITQDFNKIFSNVNLPNNLVAGSVSNIDIIFSNIIINSQWNLIDYEWTFYFPVPLNYTLYRAIHYYISSSSKRNELNNMGLLKLLGITENEIEQYQIMEKNFQNYIIGKSLTGWGIYNKIHGKCLDVSYLLDNAEQSQLRNEVQIYYDYGEGFSESNSTKLYIKPIDDKIIFKIDLNSGLKQLRIDPANDYCMIMIDKLIGFRQNYYPISYTTNGSNLTEETIVFTTSDPQIYINRIDYGTSSIEMEFNLTLISSELSLEFSKYIYSNNNEVNNKIIAENEITHLKDIISNTQTQMETKDARVLELEKDLGNIILEKNELGIQFKTFKELEYNEITVLKNQIENLGIEKIALELQFKKLRESKDSEVAELENRMKTLELEKNELLINLEELKKLEANEVAEYEIRIDEYNHEVLIRDEYIINLQKNKFWRFYKKYLIKQGNYNEYWNN